MILHKINSSVNKFYLSRYIRFINWCLSKRENIKFENSENHHIIPKCFGGSDSKDNLVYLSLREHFIAHWILTKAFPKHPICFAFYRMSKFRTIKSKEFETSKMFSHSSILKNLRHEVSIASCLRFRNKFTTQNTMKNSTQKIYLSLRHK